MLARIVVAGLFLSLAACDQKHSTDSRGAEAAHPEDGLHRN